MSNEKLVEALRLQIKRWRGPWQRDCNNDECAILDSCALEIEGLLQAHAAEAAQPQAGEPVQQFRVVPKGSVWTDVKDPEIWASVVAHPESYETRVLYTHPQPAQDARTPDFIDLSYEVWQHDEMVASCSGPEPQALTEAKHYASQYAYDGPVAVFRVSRVRINTAKESGR